MPLEIPSLRFSGYLTKTVGLQAQPALKPPVSLVAFSDQFSRSSSVTAPSQPHFSGFYRRGQYYHGHPDGEHWPCTNSSDEDDDVAPASRRASGLRGILPKGMEASLRKTRGAVGDLAQRLGGIALDGTAAVGAFVGEQIEGYAAHQAQLNDEYSDIALHSYIPLIAKTLNIPKKEGESEIAYSDRVLTLARRPTPQQEAAWESAVDTAIKKGEMEAWQAKKAIPLLNVVGRLKHKLEAPLTVAKTGLEAQRQADRERDFRDFPLVADHRHRHNRKTETEETVPAENSRSQHGQRTGKTTSRTQRSAPPRRHVTQPNEYPHYSTARKMNYRYSSNGRDRVYEDGSREQRRG